MDELAIVGTPIRYLDRVWPDDWQVADSQDFGFANGGVARFDGMGLW